MNIEKQSQVSEYIQALNETSSEIMRKRQMIKDQFPADKYSISQKYIKLSPNVSQSQKERFFQNLTPVSLIKPCLNFYINSVYSGYNRREVIRSPEPSKTTLNTLFASSEYHKALVEFHRQLWLYGLAVAYPEWSFGEVRIVVPNSRYVLPLLDPFENVVGVFIGSENPLKWTIVSQDSISYSDKKGNITNVLRDDNKSPIPFFFEHLESHVLGQPLLLPAAHAQIESAKNKAILKITRDRKSHPMVVLKGIPRAQGEGNVIHFDGDNQTLNASGVEYMESSEISLDEILKFEDELIKQLCIELAIPESVLKGSTTNDRSSATSASFRSLALQQANSSRLQDVMANERGILKMMVASVWSLENESVSMDILDTSLEYDIVLQPVQVESQAEVMQTIISLVNAKLLPPVEAVLRVNPQMSRAQAEIFVATINNNS